jgi:FkbM family methyltransferase
LHRSIAKRVGLPVPPKPSFMDEIRQLTGDVFFVQVGANCDLDDPLRCLAIERGWHGLLIEPVPHIFRKLASSYADRPAFRLANVAIADHRGTVPFHYLAEGATGALGLPSWLDGTASVNALHIARHLHDDARPFLREERLPCARLDDVLAEHGVDRIDLLLIDAEGQDLAILRQLDLKTWHPKAIVYESMHLSSGDEAAASRMLAESGYRTTRYGMDTVAWDQTQP